MSGKLPESWLRIKRVLALSTLVLLIITQWDVRPWALFSISFFIAILSWQVLDLYDQPRVWKGVIFPGTLLNLLAVTVNGGYMPVAGRTEVYRWWEPLTEHSRLIALCDIYAGASIGDMFIFTGAMIGIIGWLAHKLTQKTTTAKSA